MTELLVSTKKGLFALAGEPGGDWEIVARAFAGEPVDYAVSDPRTGRVLATMTSPFYGPKLFYTEEPATDWGDAKGREGWEQADGVSLPQGGDRALERIWVIVPGEADGAIYMGGDPGVLFQSSDGGSSWEINAGLWEQPTRPHWQPGGGGLCVHSIAPWPGDPDKLSVAISAAGVWHTDDRGRSWRRGNDGLTPRYLPDEVIAELNLPEPSPGADTALCVHHMERAPARPGRMFIQFHGGVYRSDDAGASWSEIGAGLPSDFGFPLAVDPADPDSAYVIPLVADMDRVMPEGRVRVYETRDGGESWAPRGDGLPSEHAYLTVLRQAFQRKGSGPSLELYFGSTTGQVFGSGDAGATWFEVASRLPPVYAVSAN
ncbi:MAG TPA: hypothetical protein VGI55_09905 [Solirubrobacteraceae bacterium]